ncbi:hypothetical protein MTF70_23655 [Vibrio sp. 2CM40D]|nr:hypothetical protein [Vibrio sp. 2CM40D]
MFAVKVVCGRLV